jgi:hypothetical protein
MSVMKPSQGGTEKSLAMKIMDKIEDVCFPFGTGPNGVAEHDLGSFQRNMMAIAIHVGATFDKGGREGQKAIKTGKAPVYPPPTADPTPITTMVKELDADGKETGRKVQVVTDKYDQLEMRKWELDLKRVEMKTEEWKDTNNKIFSLVMQRCTDAMQAHLETLKEYGVAKDNQDGIALIKVLLSVARHESVQVHETMGSILCLKRVTSFWQNFGGKDRSVGQYSKDLKAQLENAKAAGFNVLENDELYESYCKKHSVDKTKSDAVTKAKAAVAEEILACLFIDGLDNRQYGEQKKELHNKCAIDRADAYPKTLDQAMRYITTYVPTRTFKGEDNGDKGSGLIMTNPGVVTKKKKELQDKLKKLEEKAKRAAVEAADKNEAKGDVPEEQGNKSESVIKTGGGLCFGCKGRHKIQDCPYLTEDEKKELRKVRFKLQDMEEGLVNVNVQDDTLGIDFNDREDANLEDAF